MPASGIHCHIVYSMLMIMKHVGGHVVGSSDVHLLSGRLQDWGLQGGGV